MILKCDIDEAFDLLSSIFKEGAGYAIRRVSHENLCLCEDNSRVSIYHSGGIDLQFFTKIIEKKQRESTMLKLFPDLFFFNGDCFSSIWRRDPEIGRDQEALPRQTCLEGLVELQEKARKVNLDNGKSFICSSCDEVYNRSTDLGGNVFAAWYCNTCCESKPRVMASIEESKRNGFYE